MIYYTANLTKKCIYDENEGIYLNEKDARELLKEYGDRVGELETALASLDYSYGRDPMDLVKEKMEGEL